MKMQKSPLKYAAGMQGNRLCPLYFAPGSPTASTPAYPNKLLGTY